MQERNMHENVRVERVTSSADGKEEYSWQTNAGNKIIQGETDYVILGKTSLKLGKRTDDVPRNRTKHVAAFL